MLKVRINDQLHYLLNSSLYIAGWDSQQEMHYFQQNVNAFVRATSQIQIYVLSTVNRKPTPTFI